jgi:hypothetical protein
VRPATVDEFYRAVNEHRQRQAQPSNP